MAFLWMMPIASSDFFSYFCVGLKIDERMEKKNTYSKWMAVVLLACVCGLVSCRAEYEVTKVEGTRVAMDATWDAEPDKDALALLEPYKAGVDSVMGEVKGVAAVSMDRFRPESPLSNLIADVLRQAAASVLGRPADVGLVNVGGIRNVLTEGNITTQNIYEILPFENSLCVLTLGRSRPEGALRQHCRPWR